VNLLLIFKNNKGHFLPITNIHRLLGKHEQQRKKICYFVLILPLKNPGKTTKDFVILKIFNKQACLVKQA